MKWRDIVGMFLIASGIAGVFVGIRSATGAEDSSVISTACIGAGTMANFVAFRVMRTPRRAPPASSSSGSGGSTGSAAAVSTKDDQNA